MVLRNNSFKNVAESAGITWSRSKGYEAHSLAWLDFNRDGFQDLWISPHGFLSSTDAYPQGKVPALYLNNGDGTFTNKYSDVWVQEFGDIHGTTWNDFDNDGDADVLVSVGGQLGKGEGANLFYVNIDGELEEQAASRGLEYSLGRGRTSLWFDADEDGLLDVLLTEGVRNDGQGKTTIFHQNSDGSFENATTDFGLDVSEPTRFAQLADLTGDGKLDLIISGTYKFPAKVYNFAGDGKFQDITSQFPSIADPPEDLTKDFRTHKSARDVAIADFNNDGRNDIFFTRVNSKIEQSSLFQGSDKLLNANLVLNNNRQGFIFKSEGKVAVDVFSTNGQTEVIDASQIYIGASGRKPTAAELEAFADSGSYISVASQASNTDGASLVLDPADSSVAGITEGNKTGLYLGYDPNAQRWQANFVNSGKETIRIAVESTATITDAKTVGFNDFDPQINALSDRLWLDQDGEYIDYTSEAGIAEPTLAESVVAGDFDNDMDVDLYLANASASFNQPNLLYDNQGDGTFTIVEQAGGAAGTTTGPHILDFEIGQRLSVADYDNDGFLDIFAGSLAAKSERKTYLGDPPQLFHNQGNDHNWLQIELEGTESNRDGIGARVTVTTADGVTQFREQNGGTHAYSQNSPRLHFGLGDNQTIDSLVIQWSSGLEQEFTDVAANQILPITEGELL